MGLKAELHLMPRNPLAISLWSHLRIYVYATKPNPFKNIRQQSKSDIRLSKYNV